MLSVSTVRIKTTGTVLVKLRCGRSRKISEAEMKNGKNRPQTYDLILL